MIEWLRSEWTRGYLIQCVRRWCGDHGVEWDSRLENLSTDTLCDAFLSPTGRYGGYAQGRELMYTSRQPIYAFDDTKAMRRLKPEALRDALPRGESRGQVYIPPRPHRHRPKIKRGVTVLYDLASATGSEPLKHEAIDTSTPYDPDKAAELLARRFGDRVRRF